MVLFTQFKWSLICVSVDCFLHDDHWWFICQYISRVKIMSHCVSMLPTGGGNGTWKESVSGISCDYEEKLLLPALPTVFLLLDRGGGVFLSSGRRSRGAYEPKEQRDAQVCVHLARAHTGTHHTHNGTLVLVPAESSRADSELLPASFWCFEVFWFSCVPETQFQISLPDSYTSCK